MKEGKFPSPEALQAANEFVLIDNNVVYLNGANGQVLIAREPNNIASTAFAMSLVCEIGIAFDDFLQGDTTQGEAISKRTERFFISDLQRFNDHVLFIYVSATICKRIQQGWSSVEVRIALKEFENEIIRRHELPKQE